MLCRNHEIFATCKNGNLYELDLELRDIKQYAGSDHQPFTMDANENYVVVGYGGNGEVHVHDRRSYSWVIHLNLKVS